MRISLQWLREWVDVGNDVRALAHALTMAGLEIEGIERAGPELSGIVVGEVLSVERHPDAEKLNVCRVSNGREELQIVCGAPNVRVGMKAPLAQIGAKMPNGMEIRKAKLRGVESSGMLCSAREIGLDEDASGLLDLPPELTTGQDLVLALGLDDTIFEVNLTPNRGDCMSVAGVAREAAAARSTALMAPQIEPVKATIDATFPVRLEAPAACPKFAGRVVKGIRAGARSPWWMQERLRRAGVRPINAAVDVTNYVMLELGQPMHAYDLHRLKGAIVVRNARDNEPLKLLDGRSIELSSDISVIADEHSVLGMAGVMGGEDSGINDATTDVFLEVAFFEPDAIAGRGRRYGLITDASQRFERGVDPELQECARERATRLLIDCAGGQAGPPVVTRDEKSVAARSPITLRHRRVRHVLGVQLSDDVILDCLRRVGLEIEAAPGDDLRASWLVTPPSWRFDLRIEEDLIEEVARLYGFDNIPPQDAVGAQTILPWTETQVRKERAADLLVDRGYHEAITYSFTDAAWQSILFSGNALTLANPISVELGVMRLSLWPGLLYVVRENQRRQQTRVRLFEIGRRFAAVDGAETEVIAGVVTGSVLPEQWGDEPRKIDFFDVKADVEALLALAGAVVTFRAESHPALHPGQSARIWRDDRPIGWLGAIHPQHLKAMDLTYPAFVFEIETQPALAAPVPEFREISRYPAIRRDVAVIVDEATHADAIGQVVRAAAGELLTDLGVLSVYRGKQFEKGKKSIALGLQLQDTSRTLTDHDADAIVARVVEQLARQLNATIRDPRAG
jgi:phenylalanyl-tRNA synthetase beta chain